MSDEVVVEDPQPVAEVDAGSTGVHEVALECIAGRMGRGNARKARLRSKGYDPAAVQAEIDRIFKGSSS